MGEPSILPVTRSFLSNKMSQVPPALALQEDDVAKMLAASVHMGTQNLDPMMERYIWKRRSDGFHLLDLGKTWEKLQLAARVIVAIDNPADVCVCSGRTTGQRAVMKYANFTGATAISGRFTPGTFTNYQQHKDYKEPRLLIVTDTRMDAQPLTEASYVNLPTIAFCNSDSSLRYVDIAIPANNTGKHSIGLLYWLLAREVQYLRGTLDRSDRWHETVMPDLFFYRNPEEVEKEEALEEGGALAAPFEPTNLFDTTAVPDEELGSGGAEWSLGEGEEGAPVAPQFTSGADWAEEDGSQQAVASEIAPPSAAPISQAPPTWEL